MAAARAKRGTKGSVQRDSRMDDSPRGRILRAAAHLFMTRGYAQTTVRDLGAAVGILSGSLVVERIFAIAGMGSHFVDSAFNADYNLALGVVMVYTALVSLLNLLVDLVYGLLDPRIDLTGAGNPALTFADIDITGLGANATGLNLAAGEAS